LDLARGGEGTAAWKFFFNVTLILCKYIGQKQRPGPERKQRPNNEWAQPAAWLR
jgi:hypothetical protein